MPTPNDGKWDEARIAGTRMLIDNQIKVAMILSLEELQYSIDFLEHTTSFMPFFDPTAYMRHSDQIQTRLRILHVFYKFRSDLEKIKDSLPQEIA